MNPFLELLQSRPRVKGDLPLGSWLMTASPLCAEAMGRAGYDWLVIDREHVPIDHGLCLNLLQAIAGTPSLAVVRVPWNDSVQIKQTLDLGAQTLLIPFIQSLDEAKAAVAAIFYPPQGIRGFAAMTRASGFGGIDSYAEWANKTVACILQLETVEAIESLEAIAALEGVGALFVGPGDLAASMGYAGQVTEPVVKAKIQEAAQRANRANKPIGIVGANPALVAEYRAMGFDFVALASDLGLMMKAARGGVSEVRSLFGKISRSGTDSLVEGVY